MNIINKTFLKIALAPKSLYRKLGVDHEQMKAILVIKLTMDDRRASALFQTQRKKDKPITAATLGTMAMSALMGLLFLFSFSYSSGMSTSLTLYFTMFFVMLSASLISDFTSVLIDIRDNFIILPKPVSDRTFLVGRLMHIMIHISKVILPMSIPGLVYMSIVTNILGGLIFFMVVLLVALFAIFFINALYLVILKVTTPGRFQSIISYMQIFFAIAIYGSYQLMPRLMESTGLDQMEISTIKGIIFYPLFWFASMWMVLFNMDGNSQQFIAAIAGGIIPFLSIYIVVKFLAPSFNNKLSLINNSGGETKPVQKNAPAIKRKSFAGLLSKILTGTSAERTGFLMTWKMTSRSRDFKLKVYPSIGYLAVYAVLIFWNSGQDAFESLQGDGWRGRVLIISILYFSAIILTMALGQMIYSDKHKASWIYYKAPLLRPGEVILGGAKAIIMKFYFPVITVVTIAGLYVFGPKVLPQIILAMFNVSLISTIMVVMNNKVFPFSMQQNLNANTGTFLKNMFILMFAGIVAVIHFFLYNVLPVIIILAVLSMIATWLLAENIKKTEWAVIMKRYSDN
jgi:ABC-2 type transport system permease protein